MDGHTLFIEYLFVYVPIVLVAVNGQAWHGFYYGYKAGLTWSEAVAACEARGLRLAVIGDESRWNDAKEYVQTFDTQIKSDGDHFWIGLKHDTTSSQFKFVDGSPLTFTTAWDNNNPDDELNKPCVRAQHSTDYKWRTKSCTDKGDYLCEGFRYMTSTKNWQDSRDECANNGGTLAMIKTTEQWEAAIQHMILMNTILGISGGDIWFGLYHDTATDQYTFIDGSTISVTKGVSPWHSTEPDNPSSSHCIRMDYDGGNYMWRDKTCGSAYRYLCFQDLPSYVSPTTSTTTTNTTTTPSPTTTTTTTTTTPTTTTTTTPTTPTTTAPPTKPWWYVEYGADGLAIGNNGKSFKDSQPPVKSGIIGLAIGFGTFFIVTIIICVCWFRCCRKYTDERGLLDTVEEEDKKEETKGDNFFTVLDKPHGLTYYP